MTPTRYLAAGLAGAVLAAPAAAQQSLRERIEAARAAARARAEAEMEKKGLGKEAMQDRFYDPMTDPAMWRIQKFHIPSKTAMGLVNVASAEDKPRFYAEVSRMAVPDTLDDGSNVFFYALEDGALQIAGRGVVRKVRTKHRTRVVEAEVQSFKYAKMQHRTVNALFFSTKSAYKVLQLIKGKNPRREKWFMSTEIRGPSVEGWGLEEVEAFALGNAWKGMSEAALIAMLGPPDQSFRMGGKASHVWGEGAAALKYSIEGGQVVDMVAGGY